MAMIADAFVGKLAERLMGLAEERVTMVLGVKDDLGRLRRRLERIQPKLEAAERRRIDDPNVAAWLRELKDIMYDADDILDLCRVEGALLLDEEPSTSSAGPSSVRCHFPLFSCFTGVKLRNEIGVRIRSINGRLDEMSKDFSDFSHLSLDNNSTAKTKVRVSWVDSRQVSSGIEPMVVGREIEEATKQLVESLLVKEDRQKCRVFAIVGMGGIGKTTLAQKIYTNPLVQSEFSTTRVWLCISQDFQKIEKLKELIRELGGGLGGHETESKLMELLSSVVSGKRLFLVLDDVWQSNVWVNLLQVPLQSAAPGSRVLVTTRSENVAKGMGAVIHYVQQLSDNSGWELLCKSAFITGEEEIHSLRDTGFQIVKKCGGLPLAIKAIAGVLSTREQSKLEWQKVLKSHAWSVTELPEDLRGALYISYDDLPSHLKQCFLYCSLYPEDWMFYRVDLVRHWVGEGFVKTSGDSSMEDLAEEYYKELIQRNVLQPDPLDFGGTRCTIHDLWRSLAIFLSQDESFYGDAQKLNVTATTKLRRLSIEERGERAVIPESVIEHKSLRTLLVLKSPPRIDNDVLVRLSFLRILVLKGSGIESVPDSLGNLIHLRLLDLDHTSISSLPESLGNLTNLQLLNLSDCKSLHTLPKGITRLSNLRHLDLRDTPLSFLPKGMGRLKQLNVLQGFVIGNSSSDGDVGCGLEELESLPQLRRLQINNLQQAQAGAGVMAISNKPHLKELVLYHSEYVDVSATYTEEEMSRTERLYEELVPPQSLENLYLFGFIGRVYPSWMASASSLLTCLPYLTYLALHNSVSCQQLPPLGQLPLLRTLSILGSAAITTIGPELLGVQSGLASPKVVFPKLELLKIEDVPNWEEWSFGRDLDEDHVDVQKGKGSQKPVLLFPRLYSLVIKGCPKLRALPSGLRHSAIKELHIFGAHCLRSISNIPTLAKLLQLKDNHSLEMVSHLPALRELTALDCPSLRCVEKLDALQHVYLKDTLMERLPQWLSALLLQRQQQNSQGDYLRFYLECNLGVLRRCLEGCPDWPIIHQIPSVSVIATEGGGRLEYTKDPFSYSTTGKSL